MLRLARNRHYRTHIYVCLAGAVSFWATLATPTAPAGVIRLLARNAVELQLPANNRPEGRQPPDSLPLTGGWTKPTDTSGDVWSIDVPVRIRWHLANRPLPGFEVLAADGNPVAFVGDSESAGPQWALRGSRLFLRRPEGISPPDGFRLRYPKAVERERRLNFSMSGLTQALLFAEFTADLGADARPGVLLPAPGSISWDLALASSYELQFTPGLIVPEIRDGEPSDGATVVLELRASGKTETLWRGSAQLAPTSSVRVDLSSWAGKSVRLTFRTETGATARFDYSFIAEPVLTRTDHPRATQRVVMIFIDTLRRDHLGSYGYQRPTTPAIDRFAQQSVVFDNARSVAPWTFPAARAVLGGRHPERYVAANSVMSRLFEEGWATAMIAGNAWLSRPYGWDHGWSLHRCDNDNLAQYQVDRALKWLDESRGRNQFLVLHLMDSHLPYNEPESYRQMFAGPAIPELRDGFAREDVLKAKLPAGPKRQYVIDRYDNTIRYMDDQLARLFAVLRPDDVVVLFSDHGDEHWDHGGFEHGHTLYDELLRVPLMIRAPGFKPQRLAEPVSLLDLAPTILELISRRCSQCDGVSLKPAMRNEPDARAQLVTRPIGFGRVAHGAVRWGVLAGTEKYATVAAQEFLTELTDDPRELQNRLLGQSWGASAAQRSRLAASIGRPVMLALRLAIDPPKGSLTLPVLAQVSLAENWRSGFVPAIVQLDQDAVVELDGAIARVRWDPGIDKLEEAFLVPITSLSEQLSKLQVDLRFGAQPIPIELKLTPGLVSGEQRRPLAFLQLPDGTNFSVTLAIVPVLDGTESKPEGDAEVLELLESLGYVQ